MCLERNRLILDLHVSEMGAARQPRPAGRPGYQVAL